MARCDTCRSPFLGHLCHRCLTLPAAPTSEDSALLCEPCRQYLEAHPEAA